MVPPRSRVQTPPATAASNAAITRDAARHRGLNISLADGFAIATAQARGASLASFDARVRRALRGTGVDLAAGL